MHMLLARSAMMRGTQLVAGMLSVIAAHRSSYRSSTSDTSSFQLVSWRSGARSRREDELARSRDMSAHS